MGALPAANPALFTNISKLFLTSTGNCSTHPLTAERSRTSMDPIIISGEMPYSVFFKASKRSNLLAVKIKPKPSCAKLEAIAAPNPEEAPVINAYLTIDKIYLT